MAERGDVCVVDCVQRRIGAGYGESAEQPPYRSGRGEDGAEEGFGVGGVEGGFAEAFDGAEGDGFGLGGGAVGDEHEGEGGMGGARRAAMTSVPRVRSRSRRRLMRQRS